MVIVVTGLIAISVMGLFVLLVPRWDIYSPETFSHPQYGAIEGEELLAADRELSLYFDRAVRLLQEKNNKGALIALHRVLELEPSMVEAQVNMGYALLGLERANAAADFFLSAIELRPQQANAYYGLAVALEKTGDFAGSLGAMRSYIHLTTPDDPFLRRARSAIWEWEARLQEQRTDAADLNESAEDAPQH